MAGARLTPREQEFLVLHALGHNIAEIAESTGVSHHTVRNTIASAYKRLGVSSVAAASRKMGWLTIPGGTTNGH